jgi:hypothetical protein
MPFRFLNTLFVLMVCTESMSIIRSFLVGVLPGADHFVRLDWRAQVRGFKCPHVVTNLRIAGGTFTVDATLVMFVDLYDTLEGAPETMEKIDIFADRDLEWVSFVFRRRAANVNTYRAVYK